MMLQATAIDGVENLVGRLDARRGDGAGERDGLASRLDRRLYAGRRRPQRRGENLDRLADGRRVDRDEAGEADAAGAHAHARAKAEILAARRRDAAGDQPPERGDAEDIVGIGEQRAVEAGLPEHRLGVRAKLVQNIDNRRRIADLDARGWQGGARRVAHHSRSQDVRFEAPPGQRKAELRA